MRAQRSFFAAAVVTLAAAGAAGCGSSKPEPTPEPPPVAGVVAGNLVTNTFTVVSLDHANRWATVRRADGSTFSFRVKDSVNLAGVSAGDQVTVSYQESVAYEVKKPGEATPSTTYVGGAAGGTPGGMMGKVAQMTATITAIDQPNMLLTVQRSDGATIMTKVHDAEKLSRVKVGDLIEVTYSEAMAVEMTKAAK